MTFKKFLVYFSVICIAGCSLSCKENSDITPKLQQEYGADINYFLGLKDLRQKNTHQALSHFNKGISNGSTYVSRRCLEQKILMGNIQEQIKGAADYLKKYDDDAALLFACKIFFENKEYALLINSTDKINISESPNELVKMRLLSLHEKNDSRLKKSTLEWFITRKLTQEHADFYKDFLCTAIDTSLLESIEPIEQNNAQVDITGIPNDILFYVIKFRMLVFEAKYSESLLMIPDIEKICMTQKVIPLTHQFVIDFGKTYYYTSKKYLANGNYFIELSNSPFASDIKIKYYSLIYAGRIFDKSGKYNTKACSAFSDALSIAESDEDYDMALWFLLNAKLSISTEACIESLKTHCHKWKNPYYFSDILDNLSLLLFTGAKWNSIKKVYEIIDGYADNSTVSKYAYLTGRMIKDGYIKGTEEEQNLAFGRAFSLNGGTDVYYRLLAAKELDISVNDLEKEIFTPTTAVSAKNNPDAERLLNGYADFGFAELIYPEWQYFYSIDKNIFGLETIVKVSDFLHSCGNADSNFYYYSLHMVTKTTNLDNSPLTKKIFELSYPRNFKKEISSAAAEFDVDEYSILGLIRTESFFNPNVESNAGALGLTQLMQETFIENAEKLKIKNPDITDPATNIRLGTYYFSSLVKRLDDNELLALFAYNAGPARVKRWLNTSRIGLGKYKELPTALFLETIPFAETRNYGRKVTQSAAIYAWLYYHENPCKIVDQMM